MSSFDPASVKAALAKISVGRLISRARAPYFAAMLMQLVPRPHDMGGPGPMAVTQNGIMLFAPGWVEKQTDAIMGGCIAHECMHRILRTHERRGLRDPKRWNMAADLAINQAVRELGLELPTWVLYPEKYKFKPGLTADEYYELLDKAGIGDGDSDGGDDVAVGAGRCGSCAGNPAPNEPGDGDPDARTESDMERAVRDACEEIKAIASGKLAGKLPSMLKRWADDALQPARIPWQTKLRHTGRSARRWVGGAVVTRYDAPGRRQAGIGYGPGKPILPRLRAPRPRCAFVVDTSGSMGQADILTAMNEGAGIMKEVCGDLTFCAIDTKVHTLKQIASIREAFDGIKGGGGTDFRPAFEALLSQRNPPNIIVFATDGYGPAPEVPPHGVKVIWLLVSQPSNVPAEWGEVVQVD